MCFFQKMDPPMHAPVLTKEFGEATSLSSKVKNHSVTLSHTEPGFQQKSSNKGRKYTLKLRPLVKPSPSAGGYPPWN